MAGIFQQPTAGQQLGQQFQQVQQQGGIPPAQLAQEVRKALPQQQQPQQPAQPQLTLIELLKLFTGQ
jgi:hypothetical protein